MAAAGFLAKNDDIDFMPLMLTFASFFWPIVSAGGLALYEVAPPEHKRALLARHAVGKPAARDALLKKSE